MSIERAPSESDLGAKVSIRLHDSAGGFRDLLGILVSTNQVEKKDGTIHTFDPNEIANLRHEDAQKLVVQFFGLRFE